MELFFFHGKAVTFNYHISVVRNWNVSITKTKTEQKRSRWAFFQQLHIFFFPQSEQAIKKKKKVLRSPLELQWKNHKLKPWAYIEFKAERPPRTHTHTSAPKIGPWFVFMDKLQLLLVPPHTTDPELEIGKRSSSGKKWGGGVVPHSAVKWHLNRRVWNVTKGVWGRTQPPPAPLCWATLKTITDSTSS